MIHSGGQTFAQQLLMCSSVYLPKSSLEVGLEGIETFPLSSLPESPAQPLKKVAEVPSHDVTGVWKSTWISRSSAGNDLTHHVVLTLSQDGAQVHGDLTVTMPYDGDVTVVHELLTGSIKEKSMFLKGVSYTTVQNGKIPLYLLDEFELTLTEESLLKGMLSPGGDRQAHQVTFKKISASASSQGMKE